MTNKVVYNNEYEPLTNKESQNVTTPRSQTWVNHQSKISACRCGII